LIKHYIVKEDSIEYHRGNYQQTSVIFKILPEEPVIHQLYSIQNYNAEKKKQRFFGNKRKRLEEEKNKRYKKAELVRLAGFKAEH
jgi:hypothetical protein